MDRAGHDRGGWPTEERIDRSEHPLADWELLADALMQSLVRNGRLRVDELRRAIESTPPAEYEAAGYYERWVYAIEHILVENGVLTAAEIEQKVAEGTA